jgi:hypothetical protein
MPIAATLNGTFDGESTSGDLSGRGRLAFSSARWGSADLGQLETDVTLAGREVAFGLTARDLTLDATGSVVIDPGGALSLRAAWDPRDLAALAQRLDVKLPESSGGSAAMRVELSGVRDDTSSLRGRADISALDVSVAGQPIQLSRPGYIQYDGRTVQADNLEFAAGMSKMRLSGSLGDSSEAGLVLNLDGLLADLAFTRELWQSLFEGRTQLPPPSGSISLRVAATGSLEHPNLSASLRIASAEVPVTTRQNVTGIEIDAQYSDGLLAVNTGAAAFEGATLALTGRLPSDLFREKLPPRLQPFIVSSGGRARLSAKLLGITPSVAAPFVEPGALEDITGRIDASIDFEADDLNVERIHGSIVLDHAEIAVGGATFAQRVSTRVDVAGGRATVAAWEWGQGDDRITLAGGATLGEDPKLDLTATGALDLALMNLVLPGARVAGRADVNVRATGAASMPSVDGRVKVHEGETRIPNPRFVISGIEGTIAFAGDTLSLEKMTATVNGGDVVLAGTMHHRWFTGFEGKITLRGTGVPLDIAGVRGEADADLALTIDPRGPVLGGTVTLARSSYRESLAFAGGLFRREQRRVTGNGLDRGSPVARTRLDVHLVTKEDLLVDIQEAQLSIRFDLRVGGTVERPSLTGRATLGEGGLIYVGANRYHLVDQGSVDFSNPNRIEPELNLSAVTRVQGTEIRLGLEGTPAELQTTLTSDDPSLSRSDLVSLLVTGKTAAEAAEDGVMPGGDLLIGVLSSQLLGAAGRVVGLDTVRVERGEPDVRFDAGLVATETDPGARLTVGTNIGTDWEVVLSQSLEDSGGLTWIVSYAAWRALNVRVVSLDDGERLYGFQRDVSFGRVEETGKPVRVLAPTVSQVTIAGAGPDEAALRSLLKVGPGARFDLFRWQDDRERVERYYYERQQFEARVVTRRTLNPSAQTISLAYEIVPGSRGSIVVDGYTLSGSALRRIETAWTHAVVDGFLTEEAAAIARTELAREGFVRASVDAVVERREEEKQLHLRVTPGARAGRRTIEFSGNEQMTSERLRKALSDAGLDQEIWLDAVRVRETLQEVYREAGYREADIRVDDVDIVDDTATRPVRINEGRQFRLRGIPRVNGAHGLPVEAITEVAALSAGDVFTEARIDKARDDVDTAYRAKGFNAASVTIDAVEAPDSAEVDVTIEVDEGPQQRLGDIQTTGLHRVRPGIVDRALNLKVGEPIDLAAWNNARKRLYETGAFRSVDIEREVIRTADAPSGVRDGVMEQEVRAKVSVQEWPFMRLRYGVDVEDEPAPTTGSAAVSAESSDGRTFGLGVAADLGVRHLFGRTLSAGVAGRY